MNIDQNSPARPVITEEAAARGLAEHSAYHALDLVVSNNAGMLATEMAKSAKAGVFGLDAPDKAAAAVAKLNDIASAFAREMGAAA